MLGKPTFFFVHLFFSISCLAACDDVDKNLIAKQLINDSEYVNYVCGITYCSLPEFESLIEVRAGDLNFDGSMVACFVDPIRKAENYYIGFFLRKRDRLALQFVHFGSGLAVVRQSSGNVKIFPVEGTEIVEHGLTERSYFEWNGQAYVLTEIKQSHW
jgi:hypothetical protein